MDTNHAEIIEALQRQVRAELETAEQLKRQNDLAEKTLNELQRSRNAEQQRMRLAFDTNDKVTGVLPQIQQALRDIRDINHRLIEFERRAERTDDILLLMLTEKSPQRVEEARQDLEAEIAERETDRRKLLRTHTRNLARLNQQAAYHGTQIPVSLQNEIEAEEQAIRDLQEAPRKYPPEG